MIAVCCTGIAILIPSSLGLWMSDYGSQKCRYLPDYLHYSRVGKGIVILTLYNILPLVTLSVSYAILVTMVIRKNKISSGTQNSVERVTITSLYLCLNFLVLTSPSAVYILLNRLYGWKKNPSEEVRLAETFVMFLRQLNFANNFVINMMTNRQFRRAAMGLLKRGNAVEPEVTGNSKAPSTAWAKSTI